MPLQTWINHVEHHLTCGKMTNEHTYIHMHKTTILQVKLFFIYSGMHNNIGRRNCHSAYSCAMYAVHFKKKK